MSQFLTRQATAFSGLSPKRHTHQSTGGTFSTRLSPFWNLFSSPPPRIPAQIQKDLLSSSTMYKCRYYWIQNTETSPKPLTKILKCKRPPPNVALHFFFVEQLIVENAAIRKRVCIHHICVDYVNTLRVYASVSSHIVILGISHESTHQKIIQHES